MSYNTEIICSMRRSCVIAIVVVAGIMLMRSLANDSNVNISNYCHFDPHSPGFRKLQVC